jgi:hypothetical protein
VELPVSTTGLSAPNQTAPHVFTLCKQSICWFSSLWHK